MGRTRLAPPGPFAPDAPAGLAKLLLWPGNRYFVVAAAFFAVAVITTSVFP